MGGSSSNQTKSSEAALKLFPPLIAAFEADDGTPPEHVSDADEIDDPVFGGIFAPALHDDFFDPVPAQIVKDLFLRHVPLHLCGQRHHPTADVLAIFPIGMYSPRHIYAFHGAALRLSRAVAAEYPAIALCALMKSQLLFVFFFSRVVGGKPVLPSPFFLLPLYFAEPFYNFSHISQQSIKKDLILVFL